MAYLKDKIQQVQDKTLRDILLVEVKKLKKEKKFGLVFEDHVPECVPFYSAPIRPRATVALKDGDLLNTFRVNHVKDGDAFLCKDADGKECVYPLDRLVVVQRFGEAIYPALVPMDSVENGGDQPFHTLIEADNFHALQLLEYLYAGQVDCIYIDPPYNTGAKDWKYNNNYVDDNDSWRHSKWLAMMRRRLKLAKNLLRPDKSVLLITIDNNELHTLCFLLDQIFHECERQIVSITINPKGKSRDGRLSQVDEYLFIVYIAGAEVSNRKGNGVEEEIRWRYLRRNDIASKRGTKKGGPNQFYPIYVDKGTNKIVKIGEPLAPHESLVKAPNVPGAVAVFPINEDGIHMNWGLIAASLKSALDQGYVRVTLGSHAQQPYTIAALTAPNIKKVNEGIYQVRGTRADGSKIVLIPGGKESRPTTVWRQTRHDAGTYGTSLIREILPDKEFTFPKSLYAIVDTLRLFLGDKPCALVLDFFAGSGTTLNAINLMNASDNGKRRCILVTNNEVSADKAKILQKQGLMPGDAEYEKHGICQSVTWPRSKYTILGKRDDGTLLDGDYLTGRTITKDKRRTFKQIGFIDKIQITSTARKKELAGLLEGIPQSKIDKDTAFFVDENCAASVLFDESFADAYLDALEDKAHIETFYLVTADNTLFKRLKDTINESLGLLQVGEDEKRPLSAGFEANLAYFKLDFLDADEVQLGRKFAALLPILWLMAGAKGTCPQADVRTSFFEGVV